MSDYFETIEKADESLQSLENIISPKEDYPIEQDSQSQPKYGLTKPKRVIIIGNIKSDKD